MDFFTPVSRLLAFTTGTAATSQSRLILLTDLMGPNAKGPLTLTTLALWGAGGAGPLLVWFNFTPSPGTVAVPTPGTTTAGTPQPAQVFDAALTTPVFFKAPTMYESPSVAGVSGFYMQDLSTAGGNSYYMQLGYRGLG
jgi:hypothetical protein